MFDRLVRDIAAIPGETLRLGLVASMFMLVLFALNATQIFQYIPLRADSITQDYWAFHAAAQGAINGSAATLYDANYFESLFSERTGLLWLYPPTMIMMLEPLGMMPYGAVKYIFILMNIIAAAYAAYICCKKNIALILLVLISPALYSIVYTGQLSAIFVVLLLLGLTYSKTRPILAGICIGLLTLKPQLGLLIPFFLLANGAWRAMFVAAVVAIALAVGSVGVLGVDVWGAFWESMTSTHAEFSQRLGVKGRITIIDILRGFGLTHLASMWVSIAALVLSAGLLLSAKRFGASPRAYVALTMMLIVVSAPYFWIYDWVLMLLATLLYLSEQQARLPKYIQLLILGIWYAPLLPYIGGGVNYALLIWGLAVTTTGFMYIDIRRKGLKFVGEQTQLISFHHLRQT